MGNVPKGHPKVEKEVLDRQAEFASAVSDQVGKMVDAKLDAFREEAILAAAHTHQLATASITDKIDAVIEGLRAEAILAAGEATVVMQKAADDVSYMKGVVEQELDMEIGMLTGNADTYDNARMGSSVADKDAALGLATQNEESWAPRANRSHLTAAVLGHAAGVVTGVVVTVAAAATYNYLTQEDEVEFVVEKAGPRAVNG